MPKVIYDFGANNGDDIPYYLLKCDVVVAVEANPVLCDSIRARFPAELANGRLVVENCVINVDPAGGDVPFHICRDNHVLSQFPEPREGIERFTVVHLASKQPQHIIAENGDPFYVKIDLEHYDAEVLRVLFTEGVFPTYISAEAHTPDVFDALVLLGNYKAFKLVDGYTVPILYGDCRIDTEYGLVGYAFPIHSAGPFGDDISGPWMNTAEFSEMLSTAGFGWKDIHATNVHLPNTTAI